MQLFVFSIIVLGVAVLSFFLVKIFKARNSLVKGMIKDEKVKNLIIYSLFRYILCALVLVFVQLTSYVAMISGIELDNNYITEGYIFVWIVLLIPLVFIIFKEIKLYKNVIYKIGIEESRTNWSGIFAHYPHSIYWMNICNVITYFSLMIYLYEVYQMILLLFTSGV